MEKTLSKFSQKTQIIYLKLKVLVREEDQIPNYILSDMQILRFLMYADKDIDNALQKIRNHIKWREQNIELFDKARKYGEQVQDELKKIGFIMGSYGITKNNRPLRISIMSDGDYMDIQNKYKDDMQAYNIAYMERQVNIIFPTVRDLSGIQPDGSISIVDVKELKVSNFLKNLGAQKDLKKLSNIIMENYPLTNKRTYIVNAGTFFTTLWQLLKKLLSEKITKKVVILDEDYLPEILKEVDIENLPKCLGGKCKYKIGEYPNPWDEEYKKSIELNNLGEDYRKKIENKCNQF